MQVNVLRMHFEIIAVAIPWPVCLQSTGYACFTVEPCLHMNMSPSLKGDNSKHHSMRRLHQQEFSFELFLTIGPLHIPRFDPCPWESPYRGVFFRRLWCPKAYSGLVGTQGRWVVRTTTTTTTTTTRNRIETTPGNCPPPLPTSQQEEKCFSGPGGYMSKMLMICGRVVLAASGHAGLYLIITVLVTLICPLYG